MFWGEEVAEIIARGFATERTLSAELTGLLYRHNFPFLCQFPFSILRLSLANKVSGFRE